MSDSLIPDIVKIILNHGIKDAVVSPGSRNAPLIRVLALETEITKHIIVDERSAAFFAIGLASMRKTPVVLVCTSGSAMLNYAPALAEAYYRCIPLLVITADRPTEWIDQDDSQTINQFKGLDNIVKRSYDLTPTDSADGQWFLNRIINDAVLCCQSGRPGPVHINVRISNPGMSIGKPMENIRIIHSVSPPAAMTTADARALGRNIASPKKVMIVAGFLPPSTKINRAICRLADIPNIVVLTETIANLHCDRAIQSIDATLAAMPREDIDRFCPDILITFGGAIVSRHIKQFLRQNKPKEHWYIGPMDTTIDCFQSLTLRIEIEPEIFLPQLASAMQPHRIDCSYATDWEVLKNRALSIRQSFTSRIPWSDFKAFSLLIPRIPRKFNVQYSNGTPIRYAQIFGEHQYHRCDCNRGVSGIDGCTSTAIGASVGYKDNVTLLISGDMSAMYDIGALTLRQVNSNFKLIVIDNDGGGIFKFINSTRHLDIVNQYFSVPSHLNIGDIANACGFRCFDVYCEEDLQRQVDLFFSETQKPALMTIHTDGTLSADILTEFFNFVQNN